MEALWWVALIAVAALALVAALIDGVDRLGRRRRRPPKDGGNDDEGQNP